MKTVTGSELVRSVLACTTFRNFGRLSTVWSSRRITVTGLFIAVSLIVALSGASPAAAQSQPELEALLDRIDRLERDIRTLNTQLARGTSSTTGQTGSSEISGGAIALFDSRMTSIEADVRAATGAMEEVDHRLRTIESQLEKIVSDIEFRLSELEQGRSSSVSQGMSQQMSAVPSTGTVTQDVGQTANTVLGAITETELQNITATAQAVSGADGTEATTQETTQVQSQTQTTASVQGVSAEPVGEIAAPETVQEAALSPKDQYTNAFGLLRQAKYEEAAQALQVFIKQNPDDQLTPNARYWLGETFYVRSEFVGAAEVFFEGYRLAPTAPKAPDTLLKLGMSLGNLDKKTEACAAFGKLASEFPNASASVRTTLERERLRNGCQ